MNVVNTFFEKNKKSFFKKSVDKPAVLCYTIFVKRKETSQTGKEKTMPETWMLCPEAYEEDYEEYQKMLREWASGAYEEEEGE